MKSTKTLLKRLMGRCFSRFINTQNDEKVAFVPQAVQNAERRAYQRYNAPRYTLMLSSLLALGSAASAQAPSVNDIQPRFGIPGAPISVSGANFDFSAGLNKVYFGATKSTLYGAATTHLNATLSTGSTYAPVQVYNATTGLWAISPTPFMPTFGGSYQQNVFNFEPFYQLTGTTHPISPTIVDVDGDGMPDIVVPATADPTTSLPTIVIYRNLMTNPGSFNSSSFAPPVHITNTGTSLGIEIVFADIDGDGQRDMIVADNSAQTVAVYRNTSTPGSISFGPRADYPVNQVHDICVTDVNGDGKIDIVASSTTAINFTILENTATNGSIDASSFATPVIMAKPIVTLDIQVCDIDGDGKQDLIASNADNTLSVYRNSGTTGSITTSSYNTPASFATGGYPLSIAVGDVDGDDKQDIVVLNWTQERIGIYRNIASPGSITSSSLVDSVGFATGAYPNQLVLGDFNGDYRPDIAVIPTAGPLQLFMHNGGFGITPTTYAAPTGLTIGGSFAYWVTAGDLDGDYKPDIITSNSDDNNLGLHRNDPLPLSVPPISGPTLVCEANFVMLSHSTPGGAWSSSNTSVATMSASGYVFGVTPGSSVISYNTGAGVATTTITVKGLPGSITGTLTTCAGGVISLSNSLPGGTWSSSNPGIATVNQNTGVVTGTNPGTAVISYDNGCRASTAVVTVIAGPTGTFAVTPSTVCAGSTATLTANYSTCAGSTLSFGGVLSGSIASHTGVVSTAITNLTIEAWIKWNGQGGFQTILVNGRDGGTSGNGYVFGVEGGFLKMTLTNVKTMVSTSMVVNAGQWTHVAISRTGSLWQGYVNGNYVPMTFNNSTPITPNGNFQLGCLSGAGMPSFDGLIDEVKVWDVARVASNIVLDMNACSEMAGTTGLAGYWSMNENTGSTAADGSGNGNDLTLNNTNWAASGAVPNTYVYNTGDGGTLYGGSSQTYTYAGQGTYNATVTVNSNNGCIIMASAPVTVLYNASPITGNPGVCVGGTSILSNLSIGGTWSTANPAVATVSASGVLYGVSTGTTMVTYATACGAPVSTVVTVSDPVTGTFTVSPNPMCAGTTATLTANYGSCTGNALVFGGAISNSAAIHTGVATTATNNMTVEAWVKWNGTGGTQTIVTNGRNTSPGSGYTIFVESGLVKCSVNGVAVMIGGGTLTANTWAHITFVRAAGVWKYYLNGNAMSLTNTGAVPVTPAGFFCIGTFETGNSGTFHGTIDEVKIWNVARTATEINQLDKPSCSISATPGLVGYWNLNEGTGSTAADGSGNGNNLTLANINWTPSTVKPNTYVFWPGTGYYLSGAGTQTFTYNTAAVYSASVAVYNGGGCAATASVTVNVLPSPAAIAGNSTIFVGNGAYLSSSTPGGVWSSANNAIATVDAAGTAWGVAYGITTISYTLGGSCSALKTVSVVPMAASNSVCVGSTILLSDGVAGGTWTSGNGSIANVTSSGLVTGVGAGIVVIKHILPGGYVVNFNITVNPISPINGPASVCQLSAVTFTNSAPGGTWSSNNTAIASTPYGPSTGTIYGVGGGTATIYYITTYGCVATKAITVNPVAYITGSNYACVGQTLQLSNSLGGGTWSSASASIATVSTTGLVKGVAAGSTRVTYTMPSGCYFSAPIYVNALSPTTGPSSVCAGQSITLANTTPSGTWTSANTTLATVSSAGVVTGAAPGVVDILFNAPGGCIATKSVTVNATPTISGNNNVCAGQTIALSSSISGGTWGSSNGSIATVNSSGIVTGVGAGTVNITYGMLTGCSGVKTITVNPVSPITSLAPSVCQGSVLILGNATPGGGAWNSSNSAVAFINVSGVLVGVSAGSVVASFTSTAGCLATKTVTVNPLGTISGNMGICAGQTIQLSSSLAGGAWSSSAASIASVSASGMLKGIATGTTTIKYTMPSGCQNQMTVNVGSGTTLSGGATSICQGQTTHIDHSDVSFSGVWSSSNTSVATVVFGDVTGAGGGTAVISYTMSGCATIRTITVHPKAVITGNSAVCPGGSTTQFSANIAGGTWSGGSSGFYSISSSGLLTFNATSPIGNSVFYTTPNGCQTQFFLSPLGNMPMYGPAQVCQGSSIALSDVDLFYGGSGVWSSSNSSVATVSNSGIVYSTMPGSSIISFTNTDNCVSSQTVTVSAGPAAITGITSICQGSSTSLSNTVAGGTWIIGNSAVLTSPSGGGNFVGTGSGQSLVTYLVSSGCFATTTVDVQRNATLTGIANVCAGSTTNLTASVPGGVWSSFDGTIATVNASGVVAGVTGGSVAISYTLGTGCFATKTVTVTPTTPITGAMPVCVGQSITLSNATTGGNWSTNSGSLANITSGGVLTGVSAGTVRVSYIWPTGCQVTASLTVNDLQQSYGGTPGMCASGTMALFNNTVGGGVWSSNNMSAATVDAINGVVYGVGAGSTVIQFTTFQGCTTSRFLIVNACRQDGTTSTATATSASNIRLFPNPNKGQFTITGSLGTMTGETASLEVVNMLGQVIYRNNITMHNGNMNEQIQLPANLANGMYLLNIRTDNDVKQFHFILEQ